MNADEQPKLRSRGLHGARPGRGRRGLGESCVDGALWAGTAGNVFVSHANECSPKSNFCEEALSDPAEQTTSRVDGSSALPPALPVLTRRAQGAWGQGRGLRPGPCIKASRVPSLLRGLCSRRVFAENHVRLGRASALSSLEERVPEM